MNSVNGYIFDQTSRKWVYVGGSLNAKVYYDTVEGWDAQLNLVSEKRSIYVYTDRIRKEDNYGNVTYIPGMKIGDGTSYLIDIPFIDSGDVKEALEEHLSDSGIHVSEEDRAFWNNKCRTVDEVDGETLTFTIL